MARFCSLFSSSSGNCTYFGTGSGGVLVDAGVSAKKMTEALNVRGIDPASLSALFITHSHGDHIKGIRVFASKYSVPVFATAGTVSELEREEVLTGKFPVDIIPPCGIEAGGMKVTPFPVSHDTAQPCGYALTFPDERKAAILTDTGYISEEIMNAVTGSDLILIESNHDVGMLENGPYPYALKRRILSKVGHLCNGDCAEAAVRLVRSGTTRLYLGHLSTENNYPALAFETTRAALTQAGAKADRDYILNVCKKENDEGLVVF